MELAYLQALELARTLAIELGADTQTYRLGTLEVLINDARNDGYDLGLEDGAQTVIFIQDTSLCDDACACFLCTDEPIGRC